MALRSKFSGGPLSSPATSNSFSFIGYGLYLGVRGDSLGTDRIGLADCGKLSCPLVEAAGFSITGMVIGGVVNGAPVPPV